MTDRVSWFTAKFRLARQSILRPIKWGVRRAIRPFWFPLKARMVRIVVEAVREELGADKVRIRQIVVEAIREELGADRVRIKQLAVESIREEFGPNPMGGIKQRVVEAIREELGAHPMGGIAGQGVRTADLQMEALFSLIKLNRQLESEIAASSKR